MSCLGESYASWCAACRDGLIGDEFVLLNWLKASGDHTLVGTGG